MKTEGSDFAFFEKRKQDHITASLNDKNEAIGLSGLDHIRLLHNALPEMDFSEVTLESKIFSEIYKTPFLVSSMTAGHGESLNLNLRIAEACAKNSWLMGVGSQRRELNDEEATEEWVTIKKQVPEVNLIGNIGLSQLTVTPISAIQKLVDKMQAKAFFVHTNPLQECLQPEGTPHFSEGLSSLEKLSANLSVPVILKETGCGFSTKTLAGLVGKGLEAVDVSGFGGTHWGRIEGDRSKDQSHLQQAAETFKDWGITTVDSVLNAVELKTDYKVWASGGVRTGLDAAKLLAMGAQVVGFAKPVLQKALVSTEELDLFMKQMAFELKVALFCTGNRRIEDLQSERVWEWKKK